MDDNLRYYIASCRLLLPFSATLDALLASLATSLTPTSLDSLSSIDASDQEVFKRWGTWEENKWDKCEFTPAQVALLNKVRSEMKKVDEDERVDAPGWAFPERFDDEFLLSRREKLDQPFRLPHQQTRSEPSFARVLRLIQEQVGFDAAEEDEAMRKLSTMPGVDDALDLRLVATRDQMDFLKKSFKMNKEAKSCVDAAQSLLRHEDDDDFGWIGADRLAESPRAGSPPIFSRPSVCDSVDPLISAKEVTSIIAAQGRLEEDFSSPLGKHVKMEDWNQIEHIQRFPSSPNAADVHASPRPIWSSPVPVSTPPSTETFEIETVLFPRLKTTIKQEEDEIDSLQQLRMDHCCEPDDKEIDQLEDDEEIDQLDSDDDAIPGLAADIAALAPSLPPLATILADSLGDGEKPQSLLIDSYLKIPALPTPSPSPPLAPTSLKDFSTTSTSPFALTKATGLRALTIELGWQAWTTQAGESVWDICGAIDGETEELVERARKVRKVLLAGVEEEDDLGGDAGYGPGVLDVLEVEGEDEEIVARVDGLGVWEEEVDEEGEIRSDGEDDKRTLDDPQDVALDSAVVDIPSPTEKASTTDSPAYDYDAPATRFEEADRAMDEEFVEPFPPTQYPLMDEGSEDNPASQTRAEFVSEDVEGPDDFIYPTSSPVDDHLDHLAAEVEPCEEQIVVPTYVEQEHEIPRSPQKPLSPALPSIATPRPLVVDPPSPSTLRPSTHATTVEPSAVVPQSSWSNSVALNKFLEARGQKITSQTPPAQVASMPAAPNALPAPTLPRPSLPIATPTFATSPSSDSAVGNSSYRIIASEELLQMRAHYQALTQLGCELVDRPPRYSSVPHATLEPHLSLDGTTCVLFRRLIKVVGNAVRYEELDSNSPALTRDEAIFTTLYRLSFNFDHVVLILEESVLTSGATPPFAYTPPVIDALSQLALAIDELKSQGSHCDVELAISRNPHHSAELTRKLLDYLKRSSRASFDSCAFDSWDERGWLTVDPIEDESYLLQLAEVNSFTACAILTSCTVEEFVCMDETERRVRFASVCGIERIDRISALLSNLGDRPVEIDSPSTFIELEAEFEANGGEEEEEELNFSEFIAWEEDE